MTIQIADELLKGTQLTEKHIKEQLALLLYEKKYLVWLSHVV